MIYVRTCAYNAEKTLRRAIESILNQTYGDFLFYILDNGSTDGTRDIIRYYAEKDDRIVPFYNERNFDRLENFDFWNLIDSLSEGDYICFLDADDAYDILFLEESLRFLMENELDMVMCGTVFMDAKTWSPCGNKVLSRDIILKDKNDFENYFPAIYWNLRAMWGKLCTVKAKFPYSGANKQPEWYPVYGGDTVNVFAALANIDRIGIIAKPLHYYAIFSTSESYRWHEGREKSDVLLFEKAEKLLMEKCGRVSDRNYCMLYAVYFNAIKDTFRVLLESNLDVEKKINISRDIIIHPITQKIFITQFQVTLEERFDLFVYIVGKLLSLWKENEGINYSVLEVIFTSINREFSQLLTRESFVWYMKQCPRVMQDVVLRKYEYAMVNLIAYLNRKDINIDRDFPYILGQQLAAIQGDEDKYIFFSKRLIQWYITNNQTKCAEVELKEWLIILPEDKDLKTLQRMLKFN